MHTLTICMPALYVMTPQMACIYTYTIYICIVMTLQWHAYIHMHHDDSPDGMHIYICIVMTPDGMHIYIYIVMTLQMACIYTYAS